MNEYEAQVLLQRNSQATLLTTQQLSPWILCFWSLEMHMHKKKQRKATEAS